jgi:hypothetical protein
MPLRNHFWQNVLQQSKSALFGNFFGCDDALTFIITASSKQNQFTITDPASPEFMAARGY